MNQFTQDLSIGQLAEHKFVTSLSNYNPNVTNFKYNTSADLATLKKYDLSFELDGRQATVEVKNDIKAQETGNLCIEYSNHKGEFTGILASEADFYAILVGNIFYLFERNKLKRLAFDTTKGYRSVISYSGNAFSMLVPIADALPIAKQINLIN